MLLHMLTLATVTVATPDDLTLPDFDALEERWSAAMGEFGVPGMAVAVVANGEVVYQRAFGVRDVEGDLPVTEDSIFYIASATKPFVAMALVGLAEEGKVDLDSPIRRYLPRFQLADEAASTLLPVRDLLCHRHGLNSFPIVFLDAYTGEITEDRYYHFLKDAAPQESLRYTNVHFTLAGRVIESVTGKSWRDYLAERIFKPAGLSRTTGYADWMYAQEDVAFPSIHTAFGIERAPVRKTDATMHAAGGLGTSIRDAARWLRVNLGEGEIDGKRIVSAEGARSMQQLEAGFDEPDGWLRRIEGFGLGWQYGTYRGNRYLQHGGGYVGSTAHFSFIPDVGIGVAVLANTDGPGQGIASVVSIDVYDRALGDDSGYDPLPGFRKNAQRFLAQAGEGSSDEPEPVTAESLSLAPEAYAGTYLNEHWGTVRIEWRDGRLHAAVGGLKPELSTRGKDTFHAALAGSLSSDGRFDVRDNLVRAVLIEIDDDDRVRFERQRAK